MRDGGHVGRVDAKLASLLCVCERWIDESRDFLIPPSLPPIRRSFLTPASFSMSGPKEGKRWEGWS